MKTIFSVKQIALTGILVALAIIVGAFAHFPLFGSQVYLVGIIIFLMPIVLRMPLAILGAIISVVLTDLITGWVAYTWISIIGYTLATVVLRLASLMKFKFTYMPALIFASGIVITTYYVFTFLAIDKSLADKETLTNLVQFAIIIPVVAILYTPIRLISIA